MTSYGEVWGPIARNADTSSPKMTHPEAIAYCHSLGQRLPTIEDFEKLRYHLRTNPSSYAYPYSYNAEAVPDLRENSFWASDRSPIQTHNPLGWFHGRTGRTFMTNGTHTMSVRCVSSIID